MFQSGAEEDIALPTEYVIQNCTVARTYCICALRTILLRRISLNLFSMIGYALEAISDRGGDEDEEGGQCVVWRCSWRTCGRLGTVIFFELYSTATEVT